MKEYQIKTKDKTKKEIEVSGTVVIGAFAAVSLILILIAVFALHEYVISVCGLIILEAGMAACLHKAELWKHGVMVAAQIAAGVIIGRIPLIIICVIAYIASTVALHFMNHANN